MKSVPVLATLTLAASLVAQNVATFPSNHASITNGSSYNGGFPYSSGVSRMMAEFDAWDIGVPNGHQITAIGFRQDGSSASVSHIVQVEVRMGTTNNTAATVSSTFDSNYATGPTTVYGPALYTLPTLSSSTTGSQVWLNLTTPFTYTAGTNLLVEWRITANNNGNASWPYYLDVGSYVSTITPGTAFNCPHSGNQTARMYSNSYGAALGGTWYLYEDRGPASSLGFWLAQVNAPLVAPYSLAAIVPGIQNGCMGQLNLNAPLYVNTFTTNTGGSASWNFPVPNNRLLWNNAIVTSQAMVLDLFSPGGMVASTADQIQFGIDPAETVITSTGSATSTTGGVYRNYGMVTLFQYN